MIAGQRPWIVIVGGFLGSGKTSLMLEATKVLAQQGLRCAVVLNDQGEELVDTRQAQQNGVLAFFPFMGDLVTKLGHDVDSASALRKRIFGKAG